MSERVRIRLAMVVCALWLSGCANLSHVIAPDSAGSHSRAPVILVSVDGLRPQALGRGDTPNLDALSAEGVRARWMRPSFPTLTFPNHYTLVTGLEPDAHGVVGNIMEDPAISTTAFTMRNQDLANDARWWNAGEPIWVTAERQGAATATYYWPGSEVEIRGVRPGRWTPFDRSAPNTLRAETVVGWLTGAAAQRPRFVTLYFNDVDHVSHEHGPDSEEARDAIRAVDAAIGVLRSGLAEESVAANIVVVSDHGMATVEPGQRIALNTVAPSSTYRAVYTGAITGLEPVVGHERELASHLLQPHGHFECWRREDLPARFNFGRNPRAPHFLCLADEGWELVSDPSHAESDEVSGNHGYDNELPSMRAVFIAAGPDILDRGVIDPIRSTEVAPFLKQLLDLR